ncbi:hypothetical protein ACOWPH_22940 [Anabaena sp. PCC 7938]|uniref:hypothetical protein n=1 Tax=Anabaena sp. PCC 7938 TaxID=1296340 RepID=UPI00123790BF|nr:hypothetical protein [Anabaena sp. CCAP 1446/1C]
MQFQRKPDDFDKKVRNPGLTFLSKVPNPKTEDWKKGAYWQESLDDLCKVYGRICAYSAQWMPRTEGTPTVDHFVPKSAKPEWAYEWDNFRLACLKLNARKRNFLDVIDPCSLQEDCFILDFPSLFIQPNPNILDPLQNRLVTTIKRLKLNEDDNCVKGRLDWLLPYCQKDYPFEYLKSKAPFIAYELERQGLVEVEKIAYIMGVR